jgi:hypothetical protein
MVETNGIRLGYGVTDHRVERIEIDELVPFARRHTILEVPPALRKDKFKQLTASRDRDQGPHCELFDST